MKTMEFENYGIKREIGFKKETYQNNGNLAIQAWCVENGEFTEPYCMVTVNLEPCKENRAYIDSNNCPQAIIDWLVDSGYAYDTWNLRLSGYCEYYEYGFTEEFLQNVAV